MLKVGDKAPEIELLDQHGQTFTWKRLGKRKVLINFFPKADTPGCTQQSCLLRDIRADIGRTVIVGVSPDTSAKLLKFDEKYSPLPYLPTPNTGSRYSAVEEVTYGRQHMGIERSFQIDNGE